MISPAQLALELRDAGIASLERHPWLHMARQIALGIARREGYVTSDKLQEAMADWPAPHHNCFGAVFAKSMFKSTGFVQSQRPESHARWIQVWEAKAAYTGKATG